MSEWIRVLAAAAYFSIFWLVSIFVIGLSTKRTLFAWPSLIGSAVGGFIFGMLAVFGGRLAHGGLAVISAGVVLGAGAVRLAMRRAQRPASTPTAS
jgi:hypothetical protein